MSYSYPVFPGTSVIYAPLQTVSATSATRGSGNPTRDELDGYISKLRELEDLLGKGCAEFGLESANLNQKHRQEHAVILGKESQALLSFQQKLAVVRSGVAAAVKNPSLDAKPYIPTTDYFPIQAQFSQQTSDKIPKHPMMELKELKGKVASLRTALVNEFERC